MNVSDVQQPPSASASNWKAEAEAALADFVQVAHLAGYSLSAADLVVEFLSSPHRPPSRLPSGKMALYAFFGNGRWLKVGIAGHKSQARYTSQHYNPGSAPSTLAASLMNDAEMACCDGFSMDAPGAWIQSSCHRLNVLIDAEHGRPLLALLEAFLHARLKPRYER